MNDEAASEDDEKPTRVVAGTSETEGARTRRVSRLLTPIILLLVSAAAVGAVIAWRGFAASQQNLLQRIQALAIQSDKTRDDLADINRRWESDIQPRFDRLEKEIADVQTMQRRAAGLEPWDVENLLWLANDRLVLAHDRNTAINALQRADARLAEMNDPIYAETRRLLAQEIDALRQMPNVDVSGTAHELSTLQERLDALDVERLREAPGLGETQGEPRDQAQTEASGWRGVLHAWWQSIRSLVVIRRTREPPLLAPDQRGYLLQSLHLKLESARVALLESDQRNYRASLESARAWLTRYFDATDPEVAAIVNRLDQLDRIDVSPQAPDISASLESFRAAMDRRRQRDREGNRSSASPSRPSARVSE
jgi:uroporphyrin-3 C-methyltransferase